MLGLGLDISAAAVMAPKAVPFVPSSLFGGSDQGAAFDFTDTSKLYQTNDTSTPVTANGQSIGRVDDISGKNNHATQATAANRPTYQGYGSFDGTNDFMTASAVNMTAGDKATLIFSTRDKDAATKGVFLFGTAGAVGSCSAIWLAGTPPTLRGSLTGTGTSQMRIAGDAADTVNRVYLIEYDIAGAAATDEVKLWKDGAFPAQTVQAAGPAGTGNLGNHSICIGAGDFAGGSAMTANLWRMIFINRILTAGEKASAQAWVGSPAGVVI